MTGPEHYRAAERLLTHASDLMGTAAVKERGLSADMLDHLVARAQVHATLALAAATVAAREVGPLGDFGAEWRLNTVQDSAWTEAAS